MNLRKKYILIISIIVMLNIISKGQDTLSFSIIGNWKVLKHQDCLHVNIEDKDLLEDYNNQKNICLDAIVTFETNKVYISPEGACNFVNCNSFNQNYIKKILTQKDSSFFYPYNRCDNVVKDSIIMKILSIISSKHNEIKYFNTNCNCGMGDDTYKIIVFKNDKIALFTGFDLTLLERIPSENYNNKKKCFK